MLISLGHLAGQLGAFVGESESVKKAVENAIIVVINSNEELKKLYSSHVTNLSESVRSGDQAGDTGEIKMLTNEITSQITETKRLIDSLNNPLNHSLPSPSPSADSAKLHSKLEALKKVEKLCGFYENSNNQQNDPKNLLENLCTGLETFLGFNSASKGYNGTGIVYSDLDRLCDGVMGFLSGVLGAVKDDEAVKTYDNYMDKKLSEVLKEVNKNIGTGRTGLVDAVAAVKEWWRGMKSVDDL
ncbi:hypothetical protein, conserved [Babesia bigemina]|uniref:Uncharacterized protein n=1 Tax=Babesia bigemina TaxID=5866 RepID=A0A061BJ26_BABBI|nr:hypothetical protein, conserved [Babesia bigemina]CDR71481.1 hypothetical protein, conserved [Babesia bigemina]|eukprot:XP_012770427.1 hypothetical protein, conserved [Babesia bigemina]